MKRRTDSASSRSWSAVEPARSAKTIVTTLRSLAASAGRAATAGLAVGGAVAVSGVPHALQKRCSGRVGALQLGQLVVGASLAPHPAQKRASSGLAAPHAEQRI